MSTLTVGGMGFGKHHFSTLTQALHHASAGDLIKIKKSRLRLSGAISIPANVVIVGNPTLIDIKEKQVGFLCNAGGKISLENLVFRVPNQSNAVRVTSECTSFSLKNTVVHHTRQVVKREYFPSVVVETSSTSLFNCDIDTLFVNSSEISIKDSSIGDFYGVGSHIVSDQLIMRECDIQNVLFEGMQEQSSASFTSCTFSLNTVLKQQANLSDCLLVHSPSIASWQITTSKRADKFDLPNAVSALFINDGGRVVMDKITVSEHDEGKEKNKNSKEAEFLPTWQALAINGGDATVRNSIIDATDNTNTLVSGSISFENTTDHSKWTVPHPDQVSVSNRNSKSMLFNMLESKNISRSKQHVSNKTALQELDELIGLSNVKTHIKKLTAAAKMRYVRKERGLDYDKNYSLHMVFAGNAGTGKTTVARLVGRALYEAGVLKTTTFIEASSKDLVAGYVGQTAPKTHEVVMKALDGVLFIDEAYSLAPTGGNSFNEEAVNQLIADMENYRDRLVVILAGYTNDMKHFFQVGNEGLRSRFNNWIEFDDYTPKEMTKIMYYELKRSNARARSKRTIQLMNKGIVYLSRNLDRSSGNGRFVRNYVQQILENRDSRLNQLDVSNMSNKELMVIEDEDVLATIKSQEQSLRRFAAN